MGLLSPLSMTALYSDTFVSRLEQLQAAKRGRSVEIPVPDVVWSTGISSKASTSEGTTTALREIATWHFYVDGTNTTTVAPMKVKMNAKAWFVGHLEAGW